MMRLMSLTPLSAIAYDRETTNDRGTYCTNATTSGCNSWIAMDNVSSGGGKYSGNVIGNASLNTYLNTTWYENLAETFRSSLYEQTFFIGAIDDKAIYSKILSQSASLTWNGKIGIISIPQVLNAGLTYSSTLGVSGIKNNWITALTDTNHHMWTINPETSDNWDVWMITGPNIISKRRANRIDYPPATYYAYPVVAINSNIYTTGIGTYLDPYMLNYS